MWLWLSLVKQGGVDQAEDKADCHLHDAMAPADITADITELHADVYTNLTSHFSSKWLLTMASSRV